jgi:uncharacterized repeat protein (TIGR03803 family)
MKKFYFLVVALFCLGIGKSDAQYNVLLNFNNTNSPQGKNPTGALTLSGNRFYSMTDSGGTSSYGVVFTVKIDGSGYDDLFNFNGTTGNYPQGSLTLSGNKLYGMTYHGGISFGNIFSLDTDGTEFKDLHDFYVSYNDGYYPSGNLTLSGGVLFGMTQTGGIYGYGVIFSIDTNGNGYKILLNFDGTNGSGGNSSLTLSGNKLFGMAIGGGVYHEGCIFSIDTNGNGYKKLFDFDSASGINPWNILTLSGGTLYGTTNFGGIFGYGTIFSIDTSGNNFKVLFNFNDTNGSYAEGGPLLLQGNMLYGVTIFGGTFSRGTIFSIDTNGSEFKNLYDFPTAINGTEPISPLIYSGNVFYGMASTEGMDNAGVIYSFVPCTINAFTEPICIATIDTSNNKAEVIWGRTNSPPQGGYGAYNIYRDSSSVYVLKHSQALDSLSEYIDTSSDPSAGPVSYELSTVDSCGESALSAPHTTVYLTVSGGSSAVTLTWTPYIGFTPSVYRIFKGPALNAMVQFDSVPGTVLTFTDSFPHIGYYYGVEAVNPAGNCIPTSKIKSRNPLSASLSGSFSNGFNTTILGVPKMVKNAVNLVASPNPNNGKFTIQSSVVSSECSIEIYNVMGEKVLTQILSRRDRFGRSAQDDNLIDLTKQPNGVYFYRVLQEDGSLIGEGKVIIQK